MRRTSGQQVTLYREDRGWSLAELGRRVIPPCEPSTIQRLERGETRMTDEWRRKLARALEVSPIDLMPIDDEPDPVQRLAQEMRGLREPDRRFVIEMLRALKKRRDDDPDASPFALPAAGDLALRTAFG